jgi:hypothetical protein
VPGKGNYEYNDALPRLTAGAVVLTPRTLHRAQWSDGPVLACWPTEQMLGTISDRLSLNPPMPDFWRAGVLPSRREEAWLRAEGLSGRQCRPV